MKNLHPIMIGLVCYKYPLYDKGSYIQEFVDSMCNRSKGVVLLSTPYPNEDFPRPKNLKIKWIKPLKFPFVYSLLFEIEVFVKALIYFRKVDIINVISARGSIAIWLAGKILNKPVISTIEIINDYSGSISDKVSHIFQKIVYGLKYEAIICWSNYYYEKYLLRWNVKSPEVQIIPGGINIERFCPEIDGGEIRKKYPKDSILVVFAKPMYEYNRRMAEFLLRAMKLLEKKINIHLLLGKGEQEEIIRRYIRDIGLEKKVDFMSFVPITEIPKYIAASDIIILPFTYEATTSRSLLESLAMGKAVITTKSGEVSRIVEDQTHALLVERDEEKVSLAIEKLHNNPKLMKTLGENARKLIVKKYSIDVIAERTLKVYLKNINNR